MCECWPIRSQGFRSHICALYFVKVLRCPMGFPKSFKLYLLWVSRYRCANFKTPNFGQPWNQASMKISGTDGLKIFNLFWLLFGLGLHHNLLLTRWFFRGIGVRIPKFRLAIRHSINACVIISGLKVLKVEIGSQIRSRIGTGLFGFVFSFEGRALQADFLRLASQSTFR